MDSGFGNDVGVETVAQVNRVDIVTRGYSISIRLLFFPFAAAVWRFQSSLRGRTASMSRKDWTVPPQHCKWENVGI